MSTPIYNLTEILPSSNERFNLHNKTLREFEAQLCGSVLDFAFNEPEEPSDGDLYVVLSPASGLFINRENHFAYYEDNAWRFSQIKINQVIFTRSTNGVLKFDGTNWEPVIDFSLVEESSATVAGNAFTIYLLSGTTIFNLPVGVDGDQIILVDSTGTWNSSNLTVNRGGSDTIEDGAQTSISLNTQYGIKYFLFAGGVWRDYRSSIAVSYLSTSSVGSTSLDPQIDYLAADRTYFIDATGGNDSNDGLTLPTAWATIERGITELDGLSLGQFNVTFDLNNIFVVTNATRLILERYRTNGGLVTFLNGVFTANATNFSQNGNNFDTDGAMIMAQNGCIYVFKNLTMSATSAVTSPSVPFIKSIGDSTLIIEGTVIFGDGGLNGSDTFAVVDGGGIIVRGMGTTIAFNSTTGGVNNAFRLFREGHIEIEPSVSVSFGGSNTFVNYVDAKTRSSCDFRNTYSNSPLSGTFRYKLDGNSTLGRANDFTFTSGGTNDQLTNGSELY